MKDLVVDSDVSTLTVPFENSSNDSSFRVLYRQLRFLEGSQGQDHGVVQRDMPSRARLVGRSSEAID